MCCDNLKTNVYLFLKDWMAFEDLHRPLFREHGSIYFANDNKPSREFNYAFCEVYFYHDFRLFLVALLFPSNTHADQIIFSAITKFDFGYVCIILFISWF